MGLGAIGVFGRFWRVLAVGAGCFVLANCSGGLSGKLDPRYGVSASARVVEPGQPVPKGGGVYRVGKPYVVAGRTYVPELDPHYSAVGLASWYGDDFHGRYTANGEIFDENAITAAHPTLPLPSYVRVTNLNNHRSIMVRVNDRGPYVGNRLIDLSRKTAQLLGFYGHGVTKVKVDYVGRAPLAGSDDRILTASLREGKPAEMPIQTASNNASFVPYFDSRPLRGKAVRLGTDVPPPPDRPYRLGADATGEITGKTSSPSTMALEVADASTDSYGGENAPSASPVSAYAGSRSEARVSGFMTGRGLY